MHAIYSRGPRAQARQRLERGLLKVEHYLDSIQSNIITPEEVSRIEPFSLAFMNVNCPDDLARARRAMPNLGEGRRMACG
jgi:molybdopterin-guanine dinucleotide biosynthesis protein A